MDPNERTREFDQLDLNEDFTGPEDPLMLGSFSEESPPRMPARSPSIERDSEQAHRPQRSRRSPPPHPYAYQQPHAGSSAYRRSPRESYPPSASRYPHPGYAPPHLSPRPGHNSGTRSSPRYYPGYPPYPYYPEPYWDAPPPGNYPTLYDQDDDIPPPPPSSTKKHPTDRESDSPQTPEKLSKSRSPFRSPPMSRQKFKRSPDFQASPNFGPYGSFGLDTPSATLGPSEFSPMGPSLQEFDENAPLPFGAELRISRSHSHDSATPVIRRRKEDNSPLAGFMSELSPFDGLHSIARSPMVHQHAYDDPSSHAKPVTASGSRSESRIHSTPHGSVKKALWPRSEGTETPARLRVEIGSVGVLSTRKSLEGINNMMQSRGRESTPSQDYSRGPPQHRGPHYPFAGPFGGDMATPIKSSGYHSRPTPTSMHRPYPGSANKYNPPPPHGEYPGSASKPRFGPPPTVPPSTGKENINKKPAATPKRNPCNCKKSKCLKLYCECFAAELFCQDCNCTECGNTPNAGPMREKAIKDTRAKNPNAFKPRFSAKVVPVVGNTTDTGHNMGCRCKRSECLKKYCECFQAGVICGTKCKCVDCLNYAGSQALIDKRRKIKDQRGADFAMRVADEAWKQGRAGAPRKPSAPPASASRHPPGKSPHMPPPHMMHPSPRGPIPPHGPPPGHPHHLAYGMPPYMRGHPPPHGYPHMGMPLTPAGYPQHPPHMHGEMYPPPHHGGPHPGMRKGELKRPPPNSVTPLSATPRTPGVRVKFDPASSRKKRKISLGQDEATIPFFGMKFPAQPKTTALAIFAFLSNDDLYNAGLVCKSWSQLAMDGELWKFES